MKRGHNSVRAQLHHMDIGIMCVQFERNPFSGSGDMVEQVSDRRSDRVIPVFFGSSITVAELYISNTCTDPKNDKGLEFETNG